MIFKRFSLSMANLASLLRLQTELRTLVLAGRNLLLVDMTALTAIGGESCLVH